MKPFSVVIITFNEEKNIRRCLASLASVADEIVVVDSFSTDNTKAICLEFGVRFIEQAFLGYREQKNFALQQASHDIILSLDADEALDETLRQSIKEAREKSFPYDSYSMNRLSSFCGQWIRHGAWYPDKKIRLINRQNGKWGGENPHDKIIMEPGSSTHHLKGDILHYTYQNLEEIILQTNRFTNIQVKEMYAKGKRSGILKLVINPLSSFITGYFFKLGFLDGYNGFIIARFASYATLIKYSKLLHLQQQAPGKPQELDKNTQHFS